MTWKKTLLITTSLSTLWSASPLLLPSTAQAATTQQSLSGERVATMIYSELFGNVNGTLTAKQQMKKLVAHRILAKDFTATTQVSVKQVKQILATAFSLTAERLQSLNVTTATEQALRQAMTNIVTPPNGQVIESYNEKEVVISGRRFILNERNRHLFSDKNEQALTNAMLKMSVQGRSLQTIDEVTITTDGAVLHLAQQTLSKVTIAANDVTLQSGNVTTVATTERTKSMTVAGVTIGNIAGETLQTVAANGSTIDHLTAPQLQILKLNETSKLTQLTTKTSELTGNGTIQSVHLIDAKQVELRGTFAIAAIQATNVGHLTIKQAKVATLASDTPLKLTARNGEVTTTTGTTITKDEPVIIVPPTTTVKPVEPTKPTEPAKPVEPTKPAEPAKPTLPTSEQLAKTMPTFSTVETTTTKVAAGPYELTLDVTNNGQSGTEQLAEYFLPVSGTVTGATNGWAINGLNTAQLSLSFNDHRFFPMDVKGNAILAKTILTTPYTETYESEEGPYTEDVAGDSGTRLTGKLAARLEGELRKVALDFGVTFPKDGEKMTFPYRFEGTKDGLLIKQTPGYGAATAIDVNYDKDDSATDGVTVGTIQQVKQGREGTIGTKYAAKLTMPEQEATVAANWLMTVTVDDEQTIVPVAIAVGDCHTDIIGKISTALKQVNAVAAQFYLADFNGQLFMTALESGRHDVSLQFANAQPFDATTNIQSAGHAGTEQLAKALLPVSGTVTGAKGQPINGPETAQIALNFSDDHYYNEVDPALTLVRFGDDAQTVAGKMVHYLTSILSLHANGMNTAYRGNGEGEWPFPLPKVYDFSATKDGLIVTQHPGFGSATPFRVQLDDELSAFEGITVGNLTMLTEGKEGTKGERAHATLTPRAPWIGTVQLTVKDGDWSRTLTINSPTVLNAQQLTDAIRIAAVKDDELAKRFFVSSFNETVNFYSLDETTHDISFSWVE